MFTPEALPMNMQTKIVPAGECWEWVGARNNSGYGSVGAGMVGAKRKTMLAHRMSYQHVIGQIPEGLTLDHLCRNRACVNTDHLEPVTGTENTRRAAAVKTHCLKGHQLSGENIRIQVRSNGWKRRVCIACQRERNNSYMRQARAEGRFA